MFSNSCKIVWEESLPARKAKERREATPRKGERKESIVITRIRSGWDSLSPGDLAPGKREKGLIVVGRMVITYQSREKYLVNSSAVGQEGDYPAKKSWASPFFLVRSIKREAPGRMAGKGGCV